MEQILLGSFLFNIFLSDVFLILNEIDIASEANENAFIKHVEILMLWSKLLECQLKSYSMV